MAQIGIFLKQTVTFPEVIAALHQRYPSLFYWPELRRFQIQLPQETGGGAVAIYLYEASDFDDSLYKIEAHVSDVLGPHWKKVLVENIGVEAIDIYVDVVAFVISTFDGMDEDSIQLPPDFYERHPEFVIDEALEDELEAQMMAEILARIEARREREELRKRESCP